MEDKKYYIGQNIRLKKNNEHRTIVDIIWFKEDTFNQGNCAIITDKCEYLYEFEFEICI